MTLIVVATGCVEQSGGSVELMKKVERAIKGWLRWTKSVGNSTSCITQDSVASVGCVEVSGSGNNAELE